MESACHATIPTTENKTAGNSQGYNLSALMEYRAMFLSFFFDLIDFFEASTLLRAQKLREYAPLPARSQEEFEEIVSEEFHLN